MGSILVAAAASRGSILLIAKVTVFLQQLVAWGLNLWANHIGLQFVYSGVELYMIRPPTSCSASQGVVMM